MKRKYEKGGGMEYMRKIKRYGSNIFSIALQK